MLREIRAYAAKPLTTLLFARLPGGGLALARPIALLLMVYPAWLLASAHVVAYGMLSALLGMVLLTLLGAGLWLRSGRDFLKRSRSTWQLWLAGEVLFALGFFGWTVLRSYAPDVWQTEKPMDMAFINAINRTNEFKALAEKGDTINIVARIPSEWNPEKVLSGLNDALRAHPEANCLLLASDWAIDAVQAALEKVDKWHPTGDPKHMRIASCDLLTSAVKAMENGYIDVSVTWDAEAHAKEAVRVLMLIAQGKDPQCPKEGCLAKGSMATPANVKSMTTYWARKY
ncbi:MAG: hypothetical protein PVSMB1_17700 [Gemmatimonadaceae bacterium]